MRTIAGIKVQDLIAGVASNLAHMDSEVQAEFFNIFGKELMATCGSTNMTESQCVSIARSLCPEGRQVLEAVGFAA
jgi:hypothetical protein